MTQTSQGPTPVPQPPRWLPDLCALLDNYTIPNGDSTWLEFYSVPHAILAASALLLADPLHAPPAPPRALTTALALGTKLAATLGQSVIYDGRLQLTPPGHEHLEITAIHAPLAAPSASPLLLDAAERAAWELYECLPVNVSMIIDETQVHIFPPGH